MSFHSIMPEAELAQGKVAAVTLEGRAIIVVRGENGIFALDDLCTHNAASLGGGRVRKNAIACPMHGARFDLETGACLASALGCPPIVTHDVRVQDGKIEVALSAKPVQQPLV